MQVEASFPDLGSGTLELRMSRSSPGRYSLHDFAKNVYDVHAFAADGRELETTRPDPYGWNVAGHGGSLTVKYKVFGDRVDGTYLGIDTTHAHINMPAAIMWAHGLDDRPVTVNFEQPSELRWQVATQLHAGSSPLEFTAPNLQYLMDSPAGVRPHQSSAVHRRPAHVPLFAAPHRYAAELDDYVKDVEKIVRQEGAIFGEYPEYEPGYYTFLADYLPYANGDGMEHRNSTVMTAAGSIAASREDVLDTVAHEFSTAGTSSASGRKVSSRSISIVRTCRANSGWPRASRSTTDRSRCGARSSWTRRRLHARSGNSSRASLAPGISCARPRK
jgi:Predicted protease with the C-terminal PDZ domain